MVTRREYPVTLQINGRKITKVVIDPHYENNHRSSINDQIILGLAELLSGSSFDPDSETGKFHYFVSDHLAYQEKSYKLVWLLEENENYLGIINAYRRSSHKKRRD